MKKCDKSELTRHTDIKPAFDRRHPDPSKNFGIHGCDLRMVLKGPRGAVQFVVYTNWYLPHVRDELLNQKLGRVTVRCMFCPLPADVGYHADAPQYAGQPGNEGCQWVESGTCYYDGSGLLAEEVFNKVLVTKGSDGLWDYLERYYRARFEGAEYPAVEDYNAS